jgi:hypothetical protein
LWTEYDRSHPDVNGFFLIGSFLTSRALFDLDQTARAISASV